MLNTVNLSVLQPKVFGLGLQ